MKKYPASLFTDIGVLGDVVEHVMAAKNAKRTQN
jgi:hypothetical protein